MKLVGFSRKWRERLVAYAPLFIWICVIAYLSGNSGSFDQTASFIGPILIWLFPGASYDQISHYHAIIRKAAHVGVYAVLALIALRAFTRRRLFTSVIWNAIVAIAVVLVVASLDELNQSRLPSRTGTPYDLVYDGLGGALATITLLLLRRNKYQD